MWRARGMMSRLLMGIVCLTVWPGLASASDAPSTPWVKAHNSQVRLKSDGLAGLDKDATFLAGLEIRMQPGWKTYWRMPGENGVPPHFDFSASENVAQATVLYPAPMLMPDKGGDSIGYKSAVIFPLRVKPKDPSRAVKLAVNFEYGICRDICIPTEAKLELDLSPAERQAARDADLAVALSRVPRPLANRLDVDPVVTEIRGGLDQKPAQIEIVTNADAVFVEAPDGLFLPQPKRSRIGSGGLAAFVVDLAKAPDAKDMVGKPILITAVGKTGSVETTWTLK